MNSASDVKAKACLLSVLSLVLGLSLYLSFLGTKVDNESLRIVPGLHLGVPIIVEHCGGNVDVYGTHGLSCRHSGGRIPQHAAVNESIHHALVSEGVPVVLESAGICHDDRKRSD